MLQSFEDANKFGKEFMDTSLTSLAAMSKAAQTITAEAAEYSKKSFEASSAALEKLFASKSLDKAVEVQTEYARQSYESFIAEATRMGELCADMAKATFQPYESVLTKTK